MLTIICILRGGYFVYKSTNHPTARTSISIQNFPYADIALFKATLGLEIWEAQTFPSMGKVLSSLPNTTKKKKKKEKKTSEILRKK